MKLLFVHSGADLYGASRSLLRLVARLAKDRHSVTCVLPYDGPLVEELRNQGAAVEVHFDLPVVTRTGVRSLRGAITLCVNVLRSVARLRRLIQSKNIDLVHTNTAVVFSSGLAARLTRRPHVWHVRESFVEFGLLWVPYSFFMRLCSNAIVCVSHAVADQFGDDALSPKIRVIHDGFPVGEFTPVGQERIDRFRSTYRLGVHKLVGVVGRIKLHRKGQEVLARAVALLEGRFPNVKFLFVGSPFPGNEQHLTRLMGLVEELGIADRVVYTGDVEDIGAAYAALDISVLTSCHPEPFGGVVVESMAYGKPVIGTSIGGTVEQIENGITGVLVNPGDPRDLQRALEWLLSEPSIRQQMGQKGRERFLRLFEFEGFYQQILGTYHVQIQSSNIEGAGGSFVWF